MFDIALDRRGHAGDAQGEITIGAFAESFVADLSAWTAEDYRASWLRAAAHVLERGYGRFLVSVCAPGTHSYIGWTCRRRGDAAMLFKTIQLPSQTETYARPEDAEVNADDYAERNNDEPRLNVYRCALADIAAFEARLRGTRAS